MVTDNPVNLRGSVKQLPQEGRCEFSQERSASAIDEFRAQRAGAAGAQPECASSICCTSAGNTRRRRWQLVYRDTADGDQARTPRRVERELDANRCPT